MLRMNSGWDSQIFSNLKGLFLGVLLPLISNWIGQWSEPPKGRTHAVTSLPFNIRFSEMKNLSSFEATRASPPLLFQVKRPVFQLVSTRFMLSEKVWKAMESSLRDLLPPFFSERDLIILKSHPMIEGMSVRLFLRSAKVSRNLSLSSIL